MTRGRTRTSPYRYDRAAIRLVLETDGRAAALARWPKHAVDPIARVLGLVEPYRPKPSRPWNPMWTPLLGTKPDSILAGEWGVPVITVNAQRRKLGIPTVDRAAWLAMRRTTLATITNSELAGCLEALAKKYGITRIEVQAERRRRAVVPTRRWHSHALNTGDLRRVAILAIRQAYPAATLEQIAAVTSCSRERVRQILYLHEAVSA